jgi:hypothetical protein
MAGHVTHIGAKKMCTIFQKKNMKVKDSCENIGLDGKIILKMMLIK